MPLISIIIPIYNVELYIERCLLSVANQTMTDGVECILVDDCGTDKSVQIAEDFINSYHGNISFRIIHHEHNRGLSAARNTGIRAAKGEYVYFLDSDDTIIPECMEGFLNLISKYPAVDLLQGFISQNTPYMNQFDERLYYEYTCDRKFIKRALLDYDSLPICAANKMVRRQLILDCEIYFKEGIIHEDNHWSYFLAKYVKSLAIYIKKCYIYTENPVSITKAPNIEKETLSARIIIEDYCKNIDSFMQGEQKVAIFNFLRGTIGNGYFKNESDRKSLLNLFLENCRLYERILINIWDMQKRDSFTEYFLLRCILRLFRIDD